MIRHLKWLFRRRYGPSDRRIPKKFAELTVFDLEDVTFDEAIDLIRRHVPPVDCVDYQASISRRNGIDEKYHVSTGWFESGTP